jgi:hypothetical protein
MRLSGVVRELNGCFAAIEMKGDRLNWPISVIASAGLYCRAERRTREHNNESSSHDNSHVCIASLVGCATGYQAQGFTGGFDETQLSPNVYRVTFKGNGYTRPNERRPCAIALC